MFDDMLGIFFIFVINNGYYILILYLYHEYTTYIHIQSHISINYCQHYNTNTDDPT